MIAVILALLAGCVPSLIVFIIRNRTTRKISAEAADITMIIGRIRSVNTPEARRTSALAVVLKSRSPEISSFLSAKTTL